MKIVFVVLSCLVIVGVGAAAGLYYVGHRIKQAVVQKAAENGVDLGSIPTAASPSGHRTKVKKKPMCEYLPKEEASRLINEPIDRAVPMDELCLYYGPPGLSASLAREKSTESIRKLQKSNRGPDISELESFEQIARDLGLAGKDTSGEMPLLVVGVDLDGRAQMTAVMWSNAIFGGFFKAAEANGTTFSREIPNLGEKAVRIPKLGLNVLQGDTFVRVIPGPIPDAENKSVEIARLLLGRL